MHLGTPALIDFCRRHEADEPLVLVTIVATEGSTYRKPGAMMLIDRDGGYEGMISGGCLEGDLVEHAARVFESGEPSRVTYDMSADDDLVWSLGIGCDGVIHLLLQLLDEDGRALFRRIESSHRANRAVLLALVTREFCGLEPGTLALAEKQGDLSGCEVLYPVLASKAAEWPDWRSRLVEQAEGELILVQLPPQTRVLICGAGPDAVPVAETFCLLGWDVTVADHRPAFARAERFPAGCHVTCQRQSELAQHVDLAGLDAAIVMTHHLESDAAYLAQLSANSLPYLGALGPVSRRERLKDMAACPDRELFGPVGLDIGAELPESIALSIAAEVHAVLNRRDGASLTGKCHE